VWAEGDTEPPAADDVLGLSMRPLATRLSVPRPGVIDYAAEVRAHGDVFSGPVPPAGTAAVRRGAVTLSSGELTALGLQAGLGARDRVLSVLPLHDPAGLVAGLLAPLAAGAGVVLVRHPDTAVLAHRAGTEKVTHTAGVTVEGVTPLEETLQYPFGDPASPLR
jgi:uncharacterized protein (TIGR03089 family)